jgi:hypothetical protein
METLCAQQGLSAQGSTFTARQGEKELFSWSRFVSAAPIHCSLNTCTNQDTSCMFKSVARSGNDPVKARCQIFLPFYFCTGCRPALCARASIMLRQAASP